MKQSKTTITKISKERRRNGEVQTIEYWEVRTGSALSKVYSTPTGDRELFTLSYWADGQRKRAVLPSKEAAFEAAKTANRDLGNGNATAPDITPKKRVACARALELIEPFGVEIQWVEIKQRM